MADNGAHLLQEFCRKMCHLFLSVEITPKPAWDILLVHLFLLELCWYKTGRIERSIRVSVINAHTNMSSIKKCLFLSSVENEHYSGLYFWYYYYRETCKKHTCCGWNRYGITEANDRKRPLMSAAAFPCWYRIVPNKIWCIFSALSSLVLYVNNKDCQSERSLK